MKETINKYRFVEAFRRVRPDNFSRKGLIALFRHLEELETEVGEEIDFDVIAIGCDWAEYKDAVEAAEAFGWAAPDLLDGEERNDTSERKALEFLHDNTQAVEFEGGILVLNF